MVDGAVLQRVVAASARMFPRHGVLAAYVYGSRVSGTPRPESDLDIGYYLTRWYDGVRLSLAVELQLELGLADAAGLSVDLRDLAAAPLELRGRVLEEGVRVYSGPPAERVALERGLLARYHDYKEVFAAMHAERLRGFARRGV